MFVLWRDCLLVGSSRRKFADFVWNVRGFPLAADALEERSLQRGDVRTRAREIRLDSPRRTGYNMKKQGARRVAADADVGKEMRGTAHTFREGKG